jgi:hypothetical protein
MSLLRAREALIAGDLPRAEREITEAETCASRPDQRLDRARAGVLRVRLCSDPAVRRELLVEPMAILEELGQLRERARAQELLV